MTSSITAAIAVLNWKPRSKSRVTLSIAQCALASRLARGVAAGAAGVARLGRPLGHLVAEAPEAGEEAVDALDALVGPVAALARAGP